MCVVADRLNSDVLGICALAYVICGRRSKELGGNSKGVREWMGK